MAKQHNKATTIMSKQKKQPAVQFYVKIHEDRGYGSDIFPVVGTSCGDREYILRNKDGRTFNIYKAHCYKDRDTTRATISLRQEKKGQAQSFLDSHPVRRK